MSDDRDSLEMEHFQLEVFDTSDATESVADEGDTLERGTTVETIGVGQYETDFGAMVRQLGEASVDRDGAPVGDLEREIQFRNLKRAEKNKQAPQVRTNPPATDACLGQTVSVTSGGQEQDCCWWTAEDEDSCTIVINLWNAGAGAFGGGGTKWPSATNPSSVNYSYRPYAVIIFGTDGGAARVVVDIGTGCQVRVAASSVYVKIGMDAAPAGTAAGTMQLGAAIAFRNASHGMPITKTLYIDSLANAGTSTVVVPLFAKLLLPLQRSDLAGAVNLDFKDAAGTILYSRALTATQVMTESEPLANDVYQITVTNNGPDTSTYRLVFGLSL